MSVFFVTDDGRYQGLKQALDNQYLMDKDAYPETLPQALKLLEKFKSESFNDTATGKPAGDSGVAFAQTERYSPTCFKCGMKGHTVNDCPKLDEAGKEKFWADRKAAQEAKQGVAHVLVADAAAATPAPAPALSVASVPGNNISQAFERFQWYMALMKATEDLDVGFAQVGTVVKKKVTFATVKNKPGK